MTGNLTRARTLAARLREGNAPGHSIAEADILVRDMETGLGSVREYDLARLEAVALIFDGEPA